MQESKIVQEWQRAARLQGQRDMLLRVLERRFRLPIPEDLASAVMDLGDVDDLDRCLDAALAADSLEAFREAVQQEVGR